MKQTVLITGASRGIGASRSKAFCCGGVSCRGMLPYADGKGRRACRVTADAAAFAADIACEEEVSRMIDAVHRRFGEIHVLINNAGIAMQKLFTDTTAEDWSRIFDVNVTGTFYTCRAVLPEMIRRKSGRIVNVSSMWGVTGASCEVAYSASKAAVIGLTKALAKEVGLSGITVNCVAPGVIDTEMNANLSSADRAALCEETPLARIGTADEAAQAILFLASGRASFVTGQVLGVNGGIVI